ncbi:condensation domain-containing protein [Bacillus velezensis]|nr:condensation domain-containing protein [Bacillus velezensis]
MNRAKPNILNAINAACKEEGFHLAKDILFKAAVFRLSEKELYLVWSNHHIVMDGWSMGVLMKSLFQNYEALRAGRPAGEAKANLTLTISNGSEAGIMRRRNNIGRPTGGFRTAEPAPGPSGIRKERLPK